MTLRIGHGIDAHRFIPGRPLMLGGVLVPYSRGLKRSTKLRHSDWNWPREPALPCSWQMSRH